ncbi:hypothetical protein F5888DRAFT_1668871 [Russula emetica]|nr:hypothetical protein F5888DRAFT_1668871 [Russula emetica]
MSLTQPAREEIVRRGTFQIRCQQYVAPALRLRVITLILTSRAVYRFRETCMTLPALQSLRYLQAEVAEVADPASEEGDVLRELLAPLIGRSAPSSSGKISPPSPGTVPVFQRLMEFFPKEAKEPSADLMEVINWYEEGGGER